MSAKKEGKNPVTIERKSALELVVTRTFDAPARIVFEAWTKSELLKRWWVPKSMGMTLLSSEADVRVGGTYRFVFDLGDSKTMAFHGTYIEVKPYSRLAWTNDEAAEGKYTTTVTFEEKAGKTFLVMSEVHPSEESLKGGLDAAEATHETFAQLDELLITL